MVLQIIVLTTFVKGMMVAYMGMGRADVELVAEQDTKEYPHLKYLTRRTEESVMSTNYEAQEKVVSAIYTFALNNSKLYKNVTTSKNGEEFTVSLEAVEIALEEIMSAFNFEVEPVP